MNDYKQIGQNVVKITTLLLDSDVGAGFAEDIEASLEACEKTFGDRFVADFGLAHMLDFAFAQSRGGEMNRGGFVDKNRASRPIFTDETANVVIDIKKLIELKIA